MKKNLYHLELAVKDLDMFGNPDPVQSPDSGWSHLFGDFNSAAQFVFEIVHGYTNERIQSEIVKCKLTRYTEGGLNLNRKHPKGFHQYNFVIKLEGISLKNLNKYEINEKTYKKFVKYLSVFWKDTFKDFDKKSKKGIRKKLNK